MAHWLMKRTYCVGHSVGRLDRNGIWQGAEFDPRNTKTRMCSQNNPAYVVDARIGFDQEQEGEPIRAV